MGITSYRNIGQRRVLARVMAGFYVIAAVAPALGAFKNGTLSEFHTRTTLPIAAPGSPISFNYVNLGIPAPVAATRVRVTFSNMVSFQHLFVDLPSGAELSVVPTTTISGVFTWYDPAWHTASEFSGPTAILPQALFDELKDGVFQARLWVDAASVGTKTTDSWAFSLDLEANIGTTPEPADGLLLTALTALCLGKRWRNSSTHCNLC